MKKICTLVAISCFIYSAMAQAVEQVTDINYYGTMGFVPTEIIVYNNHLAFVANPDSFWNTLYVSDGTGPGTVPVTRINNNVQAKTVTGLISYNNKIIFYETLSQTLWSSDGTAAGTLPYTGVKVNYLNSTHTFIPLNGKLYFAGSDTINPAGGDQL